MSSTGARDVGNPAPDILPMLLQPLPSERADYIEYRLAHLAPPLLARATPFDEPRIRGYRRRLRSRFFPLGGQRQLAAVMLAPIAPRASPPCRVPTLVLHGADDPIVNVSGGQAVARAIPGASSASSPAWRHDLPAALWPNIADASPQRRRQNRRASAQQIAAQPRCRVAVAPSPASIASSSARALSPSRSMIRAHEFQRRIASSFPAAAIFSACS